MRRLLLLMTTTTYRAHAFLDAARRLGIPVTVGSERPQALAAVNPAGHLSLDFSAPKEATQAIVKFAETYPIGGIVAADDDGVILGAMASSALGLPHNPLEAVMAARNKYQMRRVLAASGIRGPHFWRFRIGDDPAAMARCIEYPCVVKPLSLSASRGVIRADDPAQFVASYQRLLAILQRPDVAVSRRRAAQEILVERFIPGAEVALEGLLTHGQLRVLALFDKPDPLDGPFFEETIYVTPSRLSAAVQEQIAACTAEVTSALGLRQGPVHAELRVNEQGPWPLEIAPRSIGGLCSRTLRFGDDLLSLEALLLRHALGLETEILERERRAAGVMMIPIPKAGILRQVTGQEHAKRVRGIEDISITIPLGQEVVPLPEGSRYLGFIFARDSSSAGVESALREAHRRLILGITPSEARPAQVAHASPTTLGADGLPVLEH
jgi:formate-dependent phosphoribosylglycinamide formyltransferase (GAR transformylase)